MREKRILATWYLDVVVDVVVVDVEVLLLCYNFLIFSLPFLLENELEPTLAVAPRL